MGFNSGFKGLNTFFVRNESEYNKRDMTELPASYRIYLLYIVLLYIICDDFDYTQFYRIICIKGGREQNSVKARYSSDHWKDIHCSFIGAV